MIRKLVRDRQVSFLGVIETKTGNLSKYDVGRVWGKSNFCWGHVEAVNSSGGILCIWDMDFLDEVEEHKGERWLCIKGTIKDKAFKCAICILDGAHSREEKLKMWEELRELKSKVGVPVVFMGNFNEILKPKEQKGNVRLSSTSGDFRQSVEDMDLIDLRRDGKKTC